METILATAFSVGLLGGVHCLAMCGGIVSAFTLRCEAVRIPINSPSGIANGCSGDGKREGVSPVAWFGTLKAQSEFNAGRLASYALAGAVVGGLGIVGTNVNRIFPTGESLVAGGLFPVQTMFFVVANGLVILLGLYLAGQGNLVLYLERVGGRLWPLFRALGQKLPDARSGTGRFWVGAVWGWTPCGLVYSALALALVSGGAWQGASVMLAFGLGTLPNIMAAGWLARHLGTRLRSLALRRAAGFLIIVAGLFGLVRVPGLAQHVRQGLLCIGV